MRELRSVRRFALPSFGMASTSTVSNGTAIEHGHLCRSDGIVALVLLLLVLALWIPRLHGPIDLRWDGSVYYILGTSLAEGKGYRLLNEPGEIQVVQYPPLLPLIVAACQKILGTNDPFIIGQSLRLLFFLIFAAYVTGTYLLLRGYLPLRYALLGTLACLLTGQTYFMSDLLYPEIPFALVTVFFFLCIQRVDTGIYPVLGGICAILAYALRTIGIVVLFAWVADSLLKRQFKRAAARATISLIPVVCWLTYISFVESDQAYQRPAYAYQRADYSFYNVSYGKNIFRLRNPFNPESGKASLGDLAERLTGNFAELATALGGAISIKMIREFQWTQVRNRIPFLPRDRWPAYAFLLLISCLIAGGMGLQLKDGDVLLPAYMTTYLVVICLTPWTVQFPRYLVPLAPLLSLSFFGTVRALRERFQTGLPEKWRTLGVACITGIVVLIFLLQAFTAYLIFARWHQEASYNASNGERENYRLFLYHDSFRRLDDAVDWLKKHAKPDSVLAVAMPHWVYLRTGLKAVMPPLEADPREAQRLLESVPVTYLILADELGVDTRKYMSPVVENFQSRWQRIYSSRVLSEFGEELPRLEIYQAVEARGLVQQK
jgi:hypothetical protein